MLLRIFSLKVIVFVVVLLVASAITAGATTRRALVIGLGQQQDTRWGKIHGDEDVQYVVKMLKKCGYSDIRTLTNEEATKQGMVLAFLELSGRCKMGDEVYIHYSGHGQLMTDINGDEADRWKGRHRMYDESWIPYDAYMTYCNEDKGEKHLSDDEVAEYLTMIRNRIGNSGRIYVIIDSCHSGDATMTGGEQDECVRGVDMTFDIPKTQKEEIKKHYKERWLTISACRPYQLCFEQKNPRIGKLTNIIIQLGDVIFYMKNSEIQKLLDQYMEANPSRLPQNPVVSGNR